MHYQSYDVYDRCTINDQNHCRIRLSPFAAFPLFRFLSPLFFSFSVDYLHSIYSITFCLLVLFPYPNQLCIWPPSFKSHHRFRFGVAHNNVFHIWDSSLSETCMQTIVCWSSAIISMCCRIQTLARGSSTGRPAIEVPSLSLNLSVPKYLALCSLIWKDWKWETSVNGCAVFWWATAPRNWFDKRRFVLSVKSLVLRLAVRLLVPRVLLWFVPASSFSGNIYWLA